MNVGKFPEIDPYEEVAQQGQVHPLSPAYVPNPMELDKHVPVHVPEPEHPECHAPSDDDIQVEDDDGDPEEDPSEEHKPKDDDEDLEEDPNEEHEPKDEDSDETEPFDEDETIVTPPPHRHRRERIFVRPQTPMAASTRALIDAFTAGSSPFPLPPTSPVHDQESFGHKATMIRRRDYIPEEDMPPQKRFAFTAPPRRCDIAESFAAARAPRTQYDFVNTVEVGQGLIRSLGHDTRTITKAADRAKDVGYVRALQAFECRMITSIEEVNLRVSYQAQVGRRHQSTKDFAVTQMMRIHTLEARACTDMVEDIDSSSYTQRFQELALMCTKFLTDETEKVDKYISGLSDNIHWNVMSARPKTLDETIELANDLMDQKLRTYTERQNDNKRKTDDSSRNNQQQQPHKKQNVARAYYNTPCFRVINAIQRNSTHTQDDASQSSGGGLRRHVLPARVCSYTDFMKCQPLNFKGTEGIVGLSQWLEKMDLVFHISGCAIDNQDKGNDVTAYTQRFQELALMCTKFLTDETEKVDKYISGLSDNIHWNVMSARPKTLDETIELANDLMDQKLRTYTERQNDNKRKTDDSSRNNQQQQPHKKQNVARAYYNTPCAALTWWNGPVRTLGDDAAYAMTWGTLKKKLMDKYCPKAYTQRFQKLALMCTKFLADETEKVKKYISGLPDNIHRNVMSARPKTLDETIELANDLMDQKLRTYAERFILRTYLCAPSAITTTLGNVHPSVENARGMVILPRIVGSIPTTTTTTKTTTITRIKKAGACYECGNTRHIKKNCPKLKNHGNGSGNGVAQGRVYALGERDASPDSNVITGTFLLNNRYAKILFDTGADRSFVSTTFSVLIDITPTTLENHYDVELADGKIIGVNIIICGCTLNFMNHPFNIDLMPVSLGSFDRHEDVPIVRDFPEVFPEDLPGIPPARPVEF
nr:hypothetical protein [Tanacetum cinerariifolium]